jgi:hypothetical protein
MKTITIENGNVLDCEDTYYVSFSYGKGFAEPSYDLITRCTVGADYKIIYKSNSGCVPGTAAESGIADAEHIAESLVSMGILKPSKEINFGYVAGKNYLA